MTAPILAISDLAVDFGQVRVVNRINLSIGTGEVVGIVGESGSGKSMTSLAIMRLLPKARVSGRIEFRGVNLLDLPRDRMTDVRGKDIAMIFQEPMSSLNPLMTVEAQIGEALYLHQRMTRQARRARTIELLGLVGIPDPQGRLGAYPHQFSGGMRQRVMIAMAIACNPALLIADEPTTALDVTIQAQVLELMKHLRRTLNTSILLVSHDLGVIAELCDRVVVMYAGQVLETGDIRSILGNAKQPYTRGLLQAIPSLTDERARLYQIPGSVPLAGTVRQGCPFFARCSLRQDICAAEMPPMVQHGESHSAACWVTAGEAAGAPS